MEFLRSCLEFYSPTGREERFAKFLSRELASHFGFKDVTIDPVGNVLGKVGSGSPIVLFCGHMDTVPGRLGVRVSGGKIFGRGAVDAKSALAAMILAAAKLSDETGFGTMEVAAVVDEEGAGTGIKSLVSSGRKYDYGVFGEPGGVEKVTLGYRGRLRFQVKVETPAAHAGSPWLGKNAIDKAIEVIGALASTTPPAAGLTDRYRSISITPTIVTGGVAANVVPGTCTIVFDVRFPVRRSSAEVVQMLKGAVIGVEENGVSLASSVADVVEGFETRKDSILVRAFTRAILKTTGARPSFLYKTGTGDMNVLGGTLGIPVVTYGPGESRLSHTSNESVSIEEFRKSIEVYRQAAMELARLL